jgi:hypothetical protein
VWQEHCVLLDTVTRCIQLLRSASSTVSSTDSARSSLTKVAVEMMNQRHWDPRAHPQWLALEVLQRITIRPRQYIVAKQLLANLGGPGLSEEERGAMLQVRLFVRMISYVYSMSSEGRGKQKTHQKATAYDLPQSGQLD